MRGVVVFLVAATLAPITRTAFADDVETHVVGTGVLMSHAQSGWARVCAAPCDVTLARGGVYKIAGDAIRESQPFALEPEHDHVVMRIDVARRGPWLAGLVVGALGSTLATSGGALAVAANISLGGYGTSSASPGTMALSGVMIGVGLVTAIVAFTFAITNARTDVHLMAR
jgi:hypothetical protein